MRDEQGGLNKPQEHEEYHDCEEQDARVLRHVVIRLAHQAQQFQVLLIHSGVSSHQYPLVATKVSGILW